MAARFQESRKRPGVMALPIDYRGKGGESGAGSVPGRYTPGR